MSKLIHRARFSRDHRWAPGRMSAYLDDELRPPVRARLEHHCAQCPECNRVLEGLRRMLSVLRVLPSAGEQPDIAASVLLRLHERPAAEPFPREGGSNGA